MTKRIKLGPISILGGWDKYELFNVSLSVEYLNLSLLGFWITVIW